MRMGMSVPMRIHIFCRSLYIIFFKKCIRGGVKAKRVESE